MTAPAGIRSTTGETATTLPGITFGSTFPRLAKLAHKLAVVRSYVPGDANHDAKPVVHRETLGANLGSFYARVAGLNPPATGLPTNMLLYPQALGPGAQKRVAIARALLLRPDFLLLDEPTTGLDNRAADAVNHVLTSLRDRGLGALVVSHDYRALRAAADRVLLVASGKAAFLGPRDAFLASALPEVRSMLEHADG